MNHLNEKVHRVIITADDYGAMRCIDLGILEAVKKGAISCISVMSNFNRFDLAMDDLAEVMNKHNSAVGIGLHINLTAGSAINGPSSLTTSDGQFLSTRKLLEQLNQQVINDIELEIDAQLNRLKSKIEQVDHLTHHMNVMYLHPNLFELLIKIAKNNNLAVRNPYSMSFDQNIKTGIPPIKKAIVKRVINSLPTILKKPSLLSTLLTMSNTRFLKEKLLIEQVDTTSNFCDLFYGQPSRMLLKKTFSTFRLGENTEIMTHPGYHERTEMIPNGIDPSYLVKRELELSTLLDNNFSDLFNDKMILTAGFSAL